MTLTAEKFALAAHSSIAQKRKYTNDDYIVHPRNVAYLVQVIGGSEAMINAAWLHDVLEDVAPTYPDWFGEDRIEFYFGKEVLDLVRWLTDVPNKMGNRETRKSIDREFISKAPDDAKTIKLADLIDNSLTICKYDADFARVYMREKRELLKVLHEGNPLLWNMANRILLKHGY